VFCVQADAAASFRRGKVNLIRVRDVRVVLGIVPYSEFNDRDVRRWLWAIGDVCSDVFCAASFALACSVFRGEFLLIHVYMGN
jgi:hypothetical protein